MVTGAEVTPVGGAKWGDEGLANRLEEAVEKAGGEAAVSARSGIPTRSVYNYTKGRNVLKLPVAMALARATGVRLEWLATGEGPMRVGDVGATVQPHEAPAPRAIFAQINADRLGDAYAAALQALAARGHTRPEPRRVMQVTMLLYDELTEAEEEDRPASSDTIEFGTKIA